jgi:hypothetical protein
MRLLLAQFRVLCVCYSKERSEFMFTAATSSPEGFCYGNMGEFIDESQLDIFFPPSSVVLKLLLPLFHCILCQAYTNSFAWKYCVQPHFVLLIIDFGTPADE